MNLRLHKVTSPQRTSQRLPAQKTLATRVLQKWQPALCNCTAAMSDKRMRPFVKEKPGAEWLEQARAMGEQLLQAKAELAELRAEIRIKNAVLEAKDRIHQAELEAKDAALQAKDRVHKAEAALLESKLQSKDTLLEAKEALIRRLQKKPQRRDDAPAAAAAAQQTSARAAGGSAAPATSPAPAPEARAADTNRAGLAADGRPEVRSRACGCSLSSVASDGFDGLTLRLVVVVTMLVLSCFSAVTLEIVLRNVRCLPLLLTVAAVADRRFETKSRAVPRYRARIVWIAA